MSENMKRVSAYLARLDRRILLVDLIRELTTTYGLTPEQAGRAIAQSVLEDSADCTKSAAAPVST